MFHNWVLGIFVKEIRTPVLFCRNFSRKCMGTCACVFSPRGSPHILRSLMSLRSTFSRKKIIYNMYLFIHQCYLLGGWKERRQALRRWLNCAVGFDVVSTWTCSRLAYFRRPYFYNQLFYFAHKLPDSSTQFYNVSAKAWKAKKKNEYFGERMLCILILLWTKLRRTFCSFILIKMKNETVILKKWREQNLL